MTSPIIILTLSDIMPKSDMYGLKDPLQLRRTKISQVWKKVTLEAGKQVNHISIE